MPLLLGWILVGVSKSISLIYVARMLCGFSHGLCYSVLPMYLAEVSSDRIRGSITIILTVMAKCGVLFSYLVGTYTSLHNAAWICEDFIFNLSSEMNVELLLVLNDFQQ